MIAPLALRFFADTRLLMLLILFIVVAGLSSLAVLPRMEDPVLRRRVALVNTRLPGADAARMEALVTERIEDAVREIEEVKELRSVSRVGISSVSIELLDSVMETEVVWSRVRSKLEDALPHLPPGATRPEFEELEVRAYALIFGLVWQDESSADLQVLRRLAIQLQDRLQNLPGTDVVDRFGDPGEEITVEVDPRRAANAGLSIPEVADHLTGYDAKTTAGQLRDSTTKMLIEFSNQLNTIDQISSIPVAHQAASQTVLADIASVRAGIPDPPERLARLDQKPAVVLGAMVRPDYRIDHWTEAAESLLSEFSTQLPKGVQVEVVLRQHDYVKHRLESLTQNLLIGAAAIAVVICVLMGWQSAMIVTLTLPLSCAMVLCGLRLLDIPIHQMSVTGLIIALGLLIDNAIVMVDEVQGRLREGDSAAAAMSASVVHLAVPLLGSTLTTALAFAPIALMPGPAGEFVGAIAISVILAIFSSLFLAMTVIPTLAARTLSSNRRQAMNGGLRLPRLADLYRRIIRVFVSNPKLGVIVSLVLPLIGFGLFTTLPEQFFPPSGRNQFYITVERPVTSSIWQTQVTADEVDSIARELPIQRIDWFYGESAPQFYYNVIPNRRGTANYAQGLVTLQPNIPPAPVIRQLQDRLNEQVVSSRVLVRQLEQGPPFPAPIEVRLFGPDLDVLRQLGEDIRVRLSGMPEVTAVRSDLDEVLPQLSFDINPSATAKSGITPTQVAQQLSATLDGRRGGSVLQDNEELPIMVRVVGTNRSDLASVGNLDVMLGDETTTPLSAIANVNLQPESAVIPRRNRMRLNEIAAYLHAGVLPSVVQSRLDKMVERGEIRLPAGYYLEFGGEASRRDDAVGNLFSTVGVLAILMLATLVLSFGSFRMAIMIGIVALLSIGLAVGALAVSGYPFGFMAIIGTMGLIGVAINDSIVVLAGIRTHAQASSGNVDAVTEQVMRSTRHVIATTLTTMVGFTPLIVDGGSFWPPMAVSIAGGVAGATLLALVLIPSLHQWWVGQRKTKNVPLSATLNIGLR